MRAIAVDQGTTGTKSFVLDDDGSFRVTLSPEAQPGNWIRTSPGTYRVTIRQFFGNWSAERPMRARIDRLGADHRRERNRQGSRRAGHPCPRTPCAWTLHRD